MDTSSSLRPIRWPVLLSLLVALILPALAADDGWIDLFDGKTLNGWKASEHASSFRVEDGMIVGDGPRAHLFYVGDDGAASFENFELSVEARPMHGANSGVYFHALWLETGWPIQAGFEVQLDNSQGLHGGYRENKMTGSLYGVRNMYKVIPQDGEWFTLTVKVQRPRVQIFVNGVKTVDYVEPANDIPGTGEHALHPLSQAGTFALQCHDVDSKVYFRHLRVRRLPAGADASIVRPIWDAVAIEQRDLGRDNFPLVDLHTNLRGDLTLDKALAFSRKTGLGLGIVANGRRGLALRDDKAALAFLEKMKAQPVFVGLRAESPEALQKFTKETRAKFDYIFAGSRPAQPGAGTDPQAFMDTLVANAVKTIASEPIDLYADATLLPASLAPRYDELWTEARMQKIIDAAVKAGVAIEINARYRVPSEKFIRLAKAAGAKFAVGSDNASVQDYGDWSYPMAIQKSVGLTWKNMWVPGHEPSRARRELVP